MLEPIARPVDTDGQVADVRFASLLGVSQVPPLDAEREELERIVYFGPSGPPCVSEGIVSDALDTRRVCLHPRDPLLECPARCDLAINLLQAVGSMNRQPARALLVKGLAVREHEQRLRQVVALRVQVVSDGVDAPPKIE